MNAIKTTRTFNFLAIVAVMMALFAVAAMPGSRASAAFISPSSEALTLSPEKDVQGAASGQIIRHSYAVFNNTSTPQKVQIAVKNDQGWSVGASSSVIEVAAGSAAKFEVKVAVPAG